MYSHEYKHVYRHAHMYRPARRNVCIRHAPRHRCGKVSSRIVPVQYWPLSIPPCRHDVPTAISMWSRSRAEVKVCRGVLANAYRLRARRRGLPERHNIVGPFPSWINAAGHNYRDHNCIGHSIVGTCPVWISAADPQTHQPCQPLVSIFPVWCQSKGKRV